MKLSQFILIIGVLSISIPATYFVATNSTETIQTSENNKSPDLSKEIAFLRLEINALKKESSKQNKIPPQAISYNDKKREKIIQSESTKEGAVFKEDTENEAQIAEQFNPEEVGKKITEDRKKEHEQIDQSFVAETADPAWSPEATSLVTSFFEAGKAGANIDVSDIQCRKTLCKIEINQPAGANGSDSFMLSFPMHVSKALGHAKLYHEQNADGSTHVTMYMARNGYDLPSDL